MEFRKFPRAFARSSSCQSTALLQSPTQLDRQTLRVRRQITTRALGRRAGSLGGGVSDRNPMAPKRGTKEKATTNGVHPTSSRGTALDLTDGSITVVHGGMEIGQGINTKVAQCCAFALSAPLQSVRVANPSTVKIAASGGTGGSATSECCCAAVMMAWDLR